MAVHTESQKVHKKSPQKFPFFGQIGSEMRNIRQKWGSKKNLSVMEREARWSLAKRMPKVVECLLCVVGVWSVF